MNVCIGRKTFTRSDFSKSLRDLGLTPSAVSLSYLCNVHLLYNHEIYIGAPCNAVIRKHRRTSELEDQACVPVVIIRPTQIKQPKHSRKPLFDHPHVQSRSSPPLPAKQSLSTRLVRWSDTLKILVCVVPVLHLQLSHRYGCLLIVGLDLDSSEYDCRRR